MIQSDHNLIVIPTFNRSAKLKRILSWYKSEHVRARIVILDASNIEKHRAANLESVGSCANFVTRIETIGQDSVPQRLLTYLDCIDDDVVAIGNDEDAFFPAFLDSGFSFLRSNPQYVVATGKYLTSARPLLGFRRITSWTDSFLGLDIDEDEAALRVINFQRLNAGGVPPLYWSVRRREAFRNSCRLALRLTYGSAHELIDQINACATGKINISAHPMLLRDESRLHYIGYLNRDVGKLYIGQDDLDEIERIARSQWSCDVQVAVKAVNSWYRPKESGESYQYRNTTKSYSRFTDVPGVRPMRLLIWLRKAIRGSCMAGILVSQLIAYLYYLFYMIQLGRGIKFLKMTRTISVQSTSSDCG